MTLVTHTLLILGAVVVGVLSVARLTRLLVIDSYPPAAWVRNKWREITKDGPWAALVDCPYCAAPWFTLVVLGWAYLSQLSDLWWIVNGWLAASYIAAWFVDVITPSESE